MAVYQRFEYEQKISKWILMQAPPDIVGEIQTSHSSGEQRLAPRDVHARVFSAAEQDWRDYICFLDDELRIIV